MNQALEVTFQLKLTKQKYGNQVHQMWKTPKVLLFATLVHQMVDTILLTSFLCRITDMLCEVNWFYTWNKSKEIFTNSYQLLFLQSMSFSSLLIIPTSYFLTGILPLTSRTWVSRVWTFSRYDRTLPLTASKFVANIKSSSVHSCNTVNQHIIEIRNNKKN